MWEAAAAKTIFFSFTRLVGRWVVRSVIRVFARLNTNIPHRQRLHIFLCMCIWCKKKRTLDIAYKKATTTTPPLLPTMAHIAHKWTIHNAQFAVRWLYSYAYGHLISIYIQYRMAYTFMCGIKLLFDWTASKNHQSSLNSRLARTHTLLRWWFFVADTDCVVNQNLYKIIQREKWNFWITHKPNWHWTRHLHSCLQYTLMLSVDFTTFLGTLWLCPLLFSQSKRLIRYYWRA